MSTAAELLDDLHSALATTYPTSYAPSAARGRVGCAVLLQSGTYQDALCDPTPMAVEVEVRIYAAGTGEQAVIDVLHHLDPVGALIRSAGWTTDNWRAAPIEESRTPYIAITATALGTG